MPLTTQNLLPHGPVPYAKALTLQRSHVEQVKQGLTPDTLLLLEHPPTVTYGKTTRPENLLLTPDEYQQRGIDLVETDRGGDVTYHGPGQLVVYPILFMGEGNRDIHRYVRRLETVVIETARTFGITEAARADWHAGVWVGDGYLAALGVKVTRWVTYHGIALNVTEDIQEGFSTIVPCGVPDKHIVSLSGVAGREISVAEAAEVVTTAFREVFQPDAESGSI